jgi:hypothetical protein
MKLIAQWLEELVLVQHWLYAEKIQSMKELKVTWAKKMGRPVSQYTSPSGDC